MTSWEVQAGFTKKLGYKTSDVCDLYWGFGRSGRVFGSWRHILRQALLLFERMSVSTATSSYAYSPFALSAMRNTSYIRIRVWVCVPRLWCRAGTARPSWCLGTIRMSGSSLHGAPSLFWFGSKLKDADPQDLYDHPSVQAKDQTRCQQEPDVRYQDKEIIITIAQMPIELGLQVLYTLLSHKSGTKDSQLPVEHIVLKYTWHTDANCSIRISLVHADDFNCINCTEYGMKIRIFFIRTGSSRSPVLRPGIWNVTSAISPTRIWSPASVSFFAQ